MIGVLITGEAFSLRLFVGSSLVALVAFSAGVWAKHRYPRSTKRYLVGIRSATMSEKAENSESEYSCPACGGNDNPRDFDDRCPACGHEPE